MPDAMLYDWLPIGLPDNMQLLTDMLRLQLWSDPDSRMVDPMRRKLTRLRNEANDNAGTDWE